MKKHNILFAAVMSLLGLLLPPHVLADKHHEPVASFNSIKLTDNIYMLQGQGKKAGGNLGLLKGKQGLFLVDANFKMSSDALKKALSEHGGADKLVYILNTHWHGDHTQGNHVFGHHAPIIAHDNVRKRLMTREEIKLFKMVSEPYPEHALPSITYSTTLNLHINDEDIEVVHFPSGHTDGDSVVFFKKANVVHMGDHLFSGFFPFVDVDHGGNVLNMAANVKTILGMINDKTRVIPGHGPLSTKKDLQDFHDMLVGTAAEVKAMKDKGMSLEEMQKKGLSAKWKDWTDGFLSTEVWIGIVYSSL